MSDITSAQSPEGDINPDEKTVTVTLKNRVNSKFPKNKQYSTLVTEKTQKELEREALRYCRIKYISPGFHTDPNVRKRCLEKFSIIYKGKPLSMHAERISELFPRHIYDLIGYDEEEDERQAYLNLLILSMITDLEKLPILEAENKLLKDENERLTTENIELSYNPGKGFVQAQKEFEAVMTSLEKNNNVQAPKTSQTLIGGKDNTGGLDEGE